MQLPGKPNLYPSTQLKYDSSLSCQMAMSVAMAIAPKTPTQRHWDAFALYLQPLKQHLMELDEFLKYWDVSREELAFICG